MRLANGKGVSQIVNDARVNDSDSDRIGPGEDGAAASEAVLDGD